MNDFYDSSKTKAYAELHIEGEEILPQRITEILGLPPESSHEVGELWELNGKTHSVASWDYKTEGKPLKEDASEPLDDLIFIFKGKIGELKKIKEIYNNCTIVIHIVVYNNQKVLPGCSLTPDQIAFLSDMGTGIDYDVYHNYG